MAISEKVLQKQIELYGVHVWPYVEAALKTKDDEIAQLKAETKAKDDILKQLNAKLVKKDLNQLDVLTMLHKNNHALYRKAHKIFLDTSIFPQLSLDQLTLASKSNSSRGGSGSVSQVATPGEHSTTGNKRATKKKNNNNSTSTNQSNSGPRLRSSKSPLPSGTTEGGGKLTESSQFRALSTAQNELYSLPDDYQPRGDDDHTLELELRTFSKSNRDYVKEREKELMKWASDYSVFQKNAEASADATYKKALRKLPSKYYHRVSDKWIDSKTRADGHSTFFRDYESDTGLNFPLMIFELKNYEHPPDREANLQTHQDHNQLLRYVDTTIKADIETLEAAKVPIPSKIVRYGVLMLSGSCTIFKLKRSKKTKKDGTFEWTKSVWMLRCQTDKESVEMLNILLCYPPDRLAHHRLAPILEQQYRCYAPTKLARRRQRHVEPLDPAKGDLALGSYLGGGASGAVFRLHKYADLAIKLYCFRKDCEKEHDNVRDLEDRATTEAQVQLWEQHFPRLHSDRCQSFTIMSPVGTPVDQHTQTSRPTVEHLRQLLQCLEFIEQCQLVHRDLNYTNLVLVHESNNNNNNNKNNTTCPNSRVVIIDWAFATKSNFETKACGASFLYADDVLAHEHAHAGATMRFYGRHDLEMFVKMVYMLYVCDTRKIEVKRRLCQYQTNLDFWTEAQSKDVNLKTWLALARKDEYETLADVIPKTIQEKINSEKAIH